MIPRLHLPKLLAIALASSISESSVCSSCFLVTPPPVKRPIFARRSSSWANKLSAPSSSPSRQSHGVPLTATVGTSRSELVLEDDDDEGDHEDDWVPDREKARQKRLNARIRVERGSPPLKEDRTLQDSVAEDVTPIPDAKSPYTEDEENVIAAMGGKTFHPDRKREEGFLGDSTLEEIAQDYSIPICYIADVLCIWGVSPPVNPKDRLGDLVTGEQAFALLEAVNSLDVSQVQDRYSNQSLLDVCHEWDIDLQSAFELAVKEGWSLPFGVQTYLRVEQEDELLRVHGAL